MFTYLFVCFMFVYEAVNMNRAVRERADLLTWRKSMKSKARRSPSNPPRRPLDAACGSSLSTLNMSSNLKRTIDELLADPAPAAAPALQATLTASNDGSSRATLLLITNKLAGVPGSETEEEEEETEPSGVYQLGTLRATPPRPLQEDGRPRAAAGDGRCGPIDPAASASDDGRRALGIAGFVGCHRAPP